MGDYVGSGLWADRGLVFDLWAVSSTHGPRGLGLRLGGVGGHLG